MTKPEVAKSTKELAELLCISIEEAWESHTSQSIRDQFTLDEIKEYLASGTAEE